MSGRYAPLPNPRTERDEMDAAFDDSDDEVDDDSSESTPLNPASTSPPSHRPTPSQSRTSHIPGTYDFENVDYDYPPPGSPPGPSATALPNEYGNSNGQIPSFSVDAAHGPQLGWFDRTARAILPSHYVHRLGFGPNPQAVIGNNNDGVFANVTAKPSAAVVVQDGDSTYLVPEDARAEAPPSYASAQADAVPQYWENTVHAPFAPGIAGEMIIDSLPSGSLFSFLWNMLVSISFQFVGFLLTYLLHTTHAARLGARAGLGVTLIQYGFALRSRGDPTEDDVGSAWSWSTPRPTFATAAEAAAYYSNNATIDTSMTITPLTPEQANAIVADATSEWLSFFLMTIGWFILLTSVLGFWRVKRWERGVLTSQRENTGAPTPEQASGPFMAHFERGFGLRGMSRSGLLRRGFGFGPREDETDRHDEAAEAGETDLMIPADVLADPERARQYQEVLQNERRLHSELRAAGLI
ncbi:hypothetical protein FB45DRAFT_417383 [Roridomyces roridus]|uniref:Metal homeostatis protein bsd2 n=1 Tax=Roridomyces roridus TaxID=1738132 RepID=A0AAD7C6N7_9AGAR|nr:hypothetical protein FB45DRAFT_417383 [Roridomyces roridus]